MKHYRVLPVRPDRYAAIVEALDRAPENIKGQAFKETVVFEDGARMAIAIWWDTNGCQILGQLLDAFGQQLTWTSPRRVFGGEYILCYKGDEYTVEVICGHEDTLWIQGPQHPDDSRWGTRYHAFMDVEKHRWLLMKWDCTEHTFAASLHTDRPPQLEFVSPKNIREIADTPGRLGRWLRYRCGYPLRLGHDCWHRTDEDYSGIPLQFQICTPPKFAFMECSTAHVTSNDMHILESLGANPHLACLEYNDGESMLVIPRFLLADPEDPTQAEMWEANLKEYRGFGLSESFFWVLATAQEFQCRGILFDPDCDRIPGLPEHDWT